MRGTPLSRKAQYIKIDEYFQEIIGLVNIGTGAIPVDASIPQISEGNEIFNFNYTPKFAGSNIQLTSYVSFRPTLLDSSTLALFVDGASDAVLAINELPGSAAFPVSFNMKYRDIITPPVPVAINFQIRGGATVVGTNLLNATNTGTDQGGVLRSWVLVEEILSPSLFEGV